MKRRWKILLWLGIVLVLLAGSFWVTLHVKPENELEAYKKQLRSQGEKLEMAELIPPPPAPQDNCLEAVTNAFAILSVVEAKMPQAMTLVAPGKALVGWQQPDARNYDFTNSWEDFAAYVRGNEPGLAMLKQVLLRPKLFFSVNYTNGEWFWYEDFVRMKIAAQKLEGAAIWNLHQGETGEPATNIIVLLTLVQRDETKALLNSHLVRLAIINISMVPTWEFLQATNVPDDQLAAVQRSWQRMSVLPEVERSFELERAWMLPQLEKLRASHTNFAGLYSSPAAGTLTWPPDWRAITERPRMAIGEVMWRSSWSYSDEIQLLKFDQIILDSLRCMQTNRLEFYKRDLDAMASRLPVGGASTGGKVRAWLLSNMDIFDTKETELNVLQGTLRIETARRIIVTAIALKRFQQGNSTWPKNLNELVPAYIDRVPIDPYDGIALKYRPNLDGTYTLYSVAENGRDDGGDPTNTADTHRVYWLDKFSPDWVWPQPASAAEVRDFYERPGN